MLCWTQNRGQRLVVPPEGLRGSGFIQQELIVVMEVGVGGWRRQQAQRP